MKTGVPDKEPVFICHARPDTLFGATPWKLV